MQVLVCGESTMQVLVCGESTMQVLVCGESTMQVLVCGEAVYNASVGMWGRQHSHCSARSLRNVHMHQHLFTIKAGVYTSIVQTAGWAYTLAQIAPLQDLGAEMGGGGGGGVYSEFYGNNKHLFKYLHALFTTTLHPQQSRPPCENCYKGQVKMQVIDRVEVVF